MDRLISFYTSVFEAELFLDLTEEGLRHVLLDLGNGFALHPFEIEEVRVPQGELPMFDRGRIDHLALRADTEGTFWELRERIFKAGASDGQVTDLGPLLSAGFTDPDGLWGEVCWDKPPATIERGPDASGWTYIEYPDRA